MDVEAILAFGYDLGANGTRKLQEADQFGRLPGIAWYDADTEHPTEDAEPYLLTAAGVEYSSGSDLVKLLKDHLGVWFVSYGWVDEPKYLLAACTLKCDWDDEAQPIDLAKLDEQVVQHELDTKLANALELLGVTPTQQRPAWLHCVRGG
ncbi:hypothetical protein ABZ897_50670 [Nonomuraea sp. NPDC046802]|uniref:hypothetical protein n=1 Tax=Nonomuraea sp. NPDC046802 TaxID=3154919 RepID=UPI00340AA53B